MVLHLNYVLRFIYVCSRAFCSVGYGARLHLTQDQRNFVFCFFESAIYLSVFIVFFFVFTLRVDMLDFIGIILAPRAES